MADRGEVPAYAQLGAKLSEGGIIKLSTIVDDERVGEPELADDRFSEESPHLGLGYLGKCLGLHPLREVVNGDKKIPSLARGKREWSQDIHPPLSEGPWGRQGA